MHEIIKINQNSKLALSKTKSLLDITNKILDKKNKNIFTILKWFQTLNIPDYYEIPSNENDILKSKYLRLDSGEHALLNITYLPDELCYLNNLERLELCGNYLQVLPEDFGNLQKLKILYLDYNELIELPASFSNLNIEELYIRTNNFYDFPNEILKILTLKTLALTGTKQKLPNEFQKLEKLENLYLGCNKLTKIPKVIFSLNNLKFLSLRNNNLIEIDDDIAKCKTLREVIISGNPNLKLSKNNLQWIQHIRDTGGYVIIDDSIKERYNFPSYDNLIDDEILF